MTLKLVAVSSRLLNKAVGIAAGPRHEEVGGRDDNGSDLAALEVGDSQWISFAAGLGIVGDATAVSRDANYGAMVDLASPACRPPRRRA